jgi:ABC-2 type transport system ATP-binding protein
MAQYKSMPNLDYAKELVNRFQFNPNVRLKAMSKGMKQKVAIVVAFMNKPDMLVLDEPTSGLDPLMQLEFDKLLLEFKKAGTTILMSSHIFSEIEKVCDRVAIIKEGKIITDVQLSDIRHAIEKTYKIEFLDSTDFKNAKSNFTKKKFYNIKANDKKNQMYIVFDDKYTNEFINELSNYKIKFINQIQESLEEYFMQYYNNGEKFSFKDIKKSILNEKKGEKE